MESALSQNLAEEKIDKYYDNLFTQLLAVTITTGNKLTGKPIQKLSENEYVKLSEGLGKKIISHSLSAKKLFEGYQLIMNGFTSPPNIDFSSIFILTRAALESYLTFHYIYISPEDRGEHEFRALCWDYAGCLERSKFPALSQKNKENKNSESDYMNALLAKITNHDYYNRLAARNAERLVNKGEWRLGKQWNHLAADTCMNESLFNNMYKYLCGYAHSSRLSIIQIQQVAEFNAQRMQARTAIPILGIVLAKYIYDYVNFIPELKGVVDFNSPEYSVIMIFKGMGESEEYTEFFAS